MIVGLGADLVEVARVERLLARWGERAARRILAPPELAEFGALRPQAAARFLARRFAAKEAAAKALGTGFGSGVGLRDIAVAHDDRGRPLLHLEGGAGMRMAELGARRAHLTITDERGHALAVVVLED